MTREGSSRSHHNTNVNMYVFNRSIIYLLFLYTIQSPLLITIPSFSFIYPLDINSNKSINTLQYRVKVLQIDPTHPYNIFAHTIPNTASMVASLCHDSCFCKRKLIIKPMKETEIRRLWNTGEWRNEWMNKCDTQKLGSSTLNGVGFESPRHHSTLPRWCLARYTLCATCLVFRLLITKLVYVNIEYVYECGM